ncbi:MAG: hypothetical protein GF387_01575 [Candidatus Portnoybacteria bacterium]|nr:hypothetical protein [Candidatus Portnoybacteria bacterium]
MNKIKEFVLDLFFPKKCLKCNRPDIYLCPACFNKIEVKKEKTCFLCKKTNQENNICQKCKSKTKIDKVIIATQYKQVEDLIKKFKYQYIKELYKPLALLILKAIKQNKLQIPKNTIIVPIPIHKRKLKQRGFNQSELMAKELSKRINIPIKTNMLKRVKTSVPQAKTKTKKERERNIKNSFKAKNVKNKNIILVDDVITTGSTIIEATKKLKNEKANKIIVLAIAQNSL